MAALRGVAVLVTRPEHQAAPLCGLLESDGATVIRFPVLRIEAVGDPPHHSPTDTTHERFDLIVFTSANAVHFGAALVPAAGGVALAAIGPATRRALQAHGLDVTVTPAGGFDSENLLSHPRLEHPAGQRILIVKGRQGRDLLRERLAARGARVTVAEVYQRVHAVYRPDELSALEARFAAGGVDVITVTSVDVATALWDLATPSLRLGFDEVPWVVPGARVSAAVRAQGVRAPLVEADSAEDHALLAAVRRWRSSVSGA
jgi:uroporphyrinogen-III synthase